MDASYKTYREVSETHPKYGALTEDIEASLVADCGWRLSRGKGKLKIQRPNGCFPQEVEKDKGARHERHMALATITSDPKYNLPPNERPVLQAGGYGASSGLTRILRRNTVKIKKESAEEDQEEDKVDEEDEDVVTGARVGEWTPSLRVGDTGEAHTLTPISTGHPIPSVLNNFPFPLLPAVHITGGFAKRVIEPRHHVVATYEKGTALDSVLASGQCIIMEVVNTHICVVAANPKRDACTLTFVARDIFLDCGEAFLRTLIGEKKLPVIVGGEGCCFCLVGDGVVEVDKKIFDNAAPSRRFEICYTDEITKTKIKRSGIFASDLFDFLKHCHAMASLALISDLPHNLVEAVAHEMMKPAYYPSTPQHQCPRFDSFYSCANDREVDGDGIRKIFRRAANVIEFSGVFDVVQLDPLIVDTGLGRWWKGDRKNVLPVTPVVTPTSWDLCLLPSAIFDQLDF